MNCASDRRDLLDPAKLRYSCNATRHRWRVHINAATSAEDTAKKLSKDKAERKPYKESYLEDRGQVPMLQPAQARHEHTRVVQA